MHVSPLFHEHLVELNKPFTRDKIVKSLKDMYPTKSPVPDGFHALFYQQFWNIMGDDVTGVVLQFLNGSMDMSKCNETYLVLIPKVKKPNTIKKCRPISLCNVVYKLISKTLTNRLKCSLPVIISDS